jgi:hypothetical protein
MKYYLVFGYQTIEKWRNFGRIQLFLNEKLVEDFPAENEKSYNKIFHNVVVSNETSINQYILDSNHDKSFLTNKHPPILSNKHTPKQFEYIDKNAVQDYGERLTAEEFAKFGQYHTYNYKKHQFSLTDTFLKQIQNQKSLKFKYFNSEGKEIEIDDKNDFVNQVLYQKRKIERRKEKVKVLPLQVQNSQPAQFKVYELDEDQLSSHKHNTFKLKIVGGWSNNTNGFVNKHNMIALFPLLLFPETFLQQHLIERIWEKSKKFFCSKTQMNSYPFYIMNNQLPQPKGNGTFTISNPPAQWPGPNWANSAHPDRYWLLGQPIGGDCEMTFYIHKKHRIYSLHNTKTPPQGLWQLNLCFLHIYKKLANLIQKQHK